MGTADSGVSPGGTAAAPSSPGAGPRATASSAGPGTVTVRYWAGARAAAGVDTDALPAAGTAAQLRESLSALRPGLAAVLPVCTLLVDGRAAAPEDPVPAGAAVEVLPPFAGG